MEEYDDFTIIKSCCQKKSDVLNQNGYEPNKAGGLLPLTLLNWSQWPMFTYTRKQSQTATEILLTLGPFCNTFPQPIAFTSLSGSEEQCEACKNALLRANIGNRNLSAN